MKVPFIDLRLQHESIKGELHAAIDQVFESSAFAGGRFVEAFETEFAAFCGCRHAVAVGNGTDALWLALLAAGVGPGSEVITVPNTFIATAEAISLCGATPVFVDIDPRTYTMDPNQLEDRITPRTKGIIPVHLFGQTADMDPILRVARRHGIAVIEDACQAHGAEYRGRRAGSHGDFGCFSFYPGKNLGACGEAGAVVTNHDEAARHMRVFRDHGQTQKYHHHVIGWNARMDGIQAAILSVKLKHLPVWTEHRRRNAAAYARLLRGVPGVMTPVEADYATHVYHVYAIRAAERDHLLRKMLEYGVQCLVHYPVPVHLQTAYRHLGHAPGAFPIAEQCAAEYLSLPMFAELNHEQIESVVAGLSQSLDTLSEDEVRRATA
jgi:dTDP-4-amino-4,6-dideoxygalactose transaminase